MPMRRPTNANCAPRATKRLTRSCARGRSTSADARRRQQQPVGARIEDVDVEAVLMRRVPEAAEVRAERAAPGPAEVADQHGRRAGVGEPVVAQAGDQERQQPVGAPAAVAATRAATERAVPRDPVRAGLGQLQPVDEASAIRCADGDRADVGHLHERRLGAGADGRQRRSHLARRARAVHRRSGSRLRREARRDLQHAHARERLVGRRSRPPRSTQRSAGPAQVVVRRSVMPVATARHRRRVVSSRQSKRGARSARSRARRPRRGSARRSGGR